jgi:hypothetical protein
MRLAICFIALVLAGPALADTTGVYELPGQGFKMTVEVADNGDLRGEVAAKPGTYFITRNGLGYIVVPTSHGPVVDRIEDAMEALMQVSAERFPNFKSLMEQAAKDTAGLDPMPLVKGEQVTVQGRQGTAYYFTNAPAPGPRVPVLVISRDPSLSQLGVGLTAQFEMSVKLSPIPVATSMGRQFLDILKTGTALTFGGAELTTVSHSTIPPSHFTLPGASESREDIIKRLRSTATGTSISVF